MEVGWLIITAVVVLVFVSMRLVGRSDPFKSAADGLGLNLTRSVPELNPRMEGMINGLPIRVDRETGEGVRYRVFYPPLGVALRLTRETTITRTLGQLGEGDIEVGGRVFDDSFRVNTSRPDALRDMITPEVRRALVRLIEAHPKLVVEDGGMTLASDIAEPTSEELTNTIITMAAAAHQLVQQRPPPLERQPITRPAPSAPPPDRRPPPRRETVAETRRDRAEEQPEAAAEPVPTPPPPPEPEPPPPAVDSGLPDDFFDNVFGANRLSFEDEGRFDEEFRGRPVRLSGIVKQVREVDQDSSVEVGEATRAVVTVAQIDSELYGKTDIDAVVFFPKGSAANLERGAELDFTGKLEKVDAFMRNLFVVDADRA